MLVAQGGKLLQVHSADVGVGLRVVIRLDVLGGNGYQAAGKAHLVHAFAVLPDNHARVATRRNLLPRFELGGGVGLHRRRVDNAAVGQLAGGDALGGQFRPALGVLTVEQRHGQ